MRRWSGRFGLTRDRIARRTRCLIACASGAIASASGCSVLGLGDTERLGVLEFYGRSAEISVPDTVLVANRFEVAFYTFGGGCVSRGDTSVDVTGNTVVVTPTDVHSDAEICTTELAHLDHTVTVRLPSAGTGTVVVAGRAEPGDSSIQRIFSVVVR